MRPDPERWQRLQELFHGAIAREPAGREAYLESACGEDADLRREVLALLRRVEETGDTLEEAVRGLLGTAGEEEPGAVRERIGPYRLLGELGRGGLATVYLAERDDGHFRKQVAIKLLRRGLESRDLLARLRQERQILAGLEHEHIARLHDGAETEDGQPYLVLEHVEGEPLDLYCDLRGLALEERLLLLRKVCSAVEHAHRNLVIHRDLKPSNILVTAEGSPKLLDFGIAKLLHPELSPETLAETRPQARLLTPAYASPEQLRGEALTTSTDVYSLGVILYRLLTGRLPHEGASDRPEELVRQRGEKEPERPSTVASRAAADATSSERSPVPPRQLAGDLDNIALKALAPEPGERYSSVEQLSEDLRRHLEGEPVLARPATLGYRLDKFLRRHRAGVAATLAALAALLLLGWLHTERLKQERDFADEARTEALRSKAEAERERDLAERSRKEAMRSNAEKDLMTIYLLDMLKEDETAQEESLTVIGRLGRLAEQLDVLVQKPESLVFQKSVLGRIYRGLGKYVEAQPLLEESLRLRQSLDGEESLETVRGRLDLTELLMDLGDLEEAGQLLEQALATLDRLVEEPHEEIARALANRSMLHYGRGDPAAAEKDLRRALAMWSHLGIEDRDVATAWNNLAVMLHDSGRLEKAGESYGRARVLKESLFELPLELATLDLNLATLRKDLGDEEEALALMRQAYSVRSELLPETDPHRLNTARTLAQLLARLDQVEEAESLFSRTLSGYRRGGPGIPGLAPLLQDFGDLKLRQGRAAAAEELLREALELRRAVPQPNTCRIAAAQVSLGTALTQLGRFSEAKPLLLTTRQGLSEACASRPDLSQELERRCRESLLALPASNPDNESAW